MTTHERALIVVDMQNGFCHPQGSVPVAGMALADVDRAVASNALVVADARRNGVPVIFTRHVYRPGRSDEARTSAECNRHWPISVGLPKAAGTAT
jgi:ureidoacrylate peracid hydrolase